MEIEVIGMALNLGANKLGVENGYKVLEEKLNFKQIFSDKNVISSCISSPSFESIKNTDSLMKNKDEIFEANTKLADKVYTSLKNGKFPLIVGGDHALSWGSISGVTKHNPNIGCIYIDAHGDFNLAEVSPSHNIHGMHMAYLMGLADSPLNDWYEEGIKLNKRNVFFIGTRSLDTGEIVLAKKHNLNIQTSNDIRRNGIKEETTKLLSLIEKSGLENFHISLDIDVIDPTKAPGTGVPEKDGITVEDVEYLIKKIFENKNIISMDFVEFNPLLDKNNETLNVCKRILETLNKEIKIPTSC